MPTFNRAKALASGMTEEQIDAYLASPQARVDSASAGQVMPQPGSMRANPLGGAIGAVTEGLSGLRGVGLGVGGAGALYLAKRALGGVQNRAKPSPPPQPRTPKLSSTLVELSEADIAKHPEFKAYDPGQTISRKRYEAVKEAAAAQPSGPDRTVVKGYERAKPAPKPRAGEPRVKDSPEAIREAFGMVEGGGPRPVEPGIGGPSRHNVEYSSGSKGHIRIEDMPVSHIRNAMNKLSKQIGPGNKYTPMARAQLQAMKDELTHRMNAGIKTNQTYQVPEELPSVQRGFRGGLRSLGNPGSIGGGALGILGLLLGAQDIPQQMDEAHQLLLESELSRMDPATRRALSEGRPIY